MVTISKFSNTIQYNLKTTLDSSGLTKLQSQIRQTQSELSRLQSLNLIDDKQVTEAKARLQSLQTALNKSFNTKIGMLDMSAFQKNLAKSGTSIAQLGSAFSVAGSKGTTAFNSLVGQLGRIDTRMQSLSKSTDKVINTIGNTVRWGVIASGFSQVMNSIHSAVDYVKDLDSSLTNIMMVTDYSKEQMNDYAKSANEAAKALGSTTVAMTDATTVFAQQGFDLDKSSQLAELSVKLANASGQDTATTSDQITAYMNAYGLDSSMDKLTSAMNSWAEVANDSAADVEELATAAQKAASTANTVGVSMDQLNAQIATIESVTREAPENIGNGLKTIYARFSDVSMGKTLDDGVSLGTVTSTLQNVGVDVLDSNGKMREVGNIMEDLMDVWGQMDSTQKNAIATTLAGKYQLSRFEALMNRSDLYDTYKQSSIKGAENGTLDTMNEKYVNSLEGRLNQLQATVEGVFNNLFRTDDFYDMIGALTNAIDLMDKFTQSIGGGSAALTALAAAGTKAFSTQIGRGISNAIVNSSGKATESENKAQKQELLYQMGVARKDELSSQQQRVLDVASSGLQKQQYMTEEEVEQWNAQLQQVIQSMNTIEELQESVNKKVEAHNQAMSLSGIEGRDLNPSFDTKDLMDMRTINNEQGAVTGTQRYSQQLKTIGELKQDSQEMLKSFSSLDLVEQIDGLQGLVEEFQIAEREIPGSTEAITTSIADLNLSIKQLQEGTEDSDAKIQTRLQNTVNSLGGFQQEINNVIESGNLTTNKALEQVAQASDQIKTETAELEAQMEHLESLNQTYDTRETVIQVTNLVSGIGQLAFAWQSFQSLGSLWVDEDTSVGDKVLETVLNLSFTIPTLVTGLQDIVTGYKALKAALDAQNAAEIVVNAAKAAEIALNEKLIKQEQELAAAKGTSTAASEAEAAADTASAAGDVLTSGKGKKSSKKSISTKDISTVSKTGETATKALTSATAAASSFGTSLKNILSTGGKLLLGATKIVPIIGAIATGVGVLGTAVGAYSTYQDRIQKTKEAMGQDDDSYATPSDIASQKKSFETLYEQYKEGTATSSQLKEAASKINDTLDDQTLKVLAAKGAWDEYLMAMQAESFSTTENNLEKITDAAQQSAKNVENTGTNQLLPFISGQSSSTARTKIAQQTSSLSNWTGDWEFNQGSSGVQRLEDLDKADKIFEEEISAAQERVNAAQEGTQEYKDLNKTLQDLQADYGALKELEESIAGDRQAYKNNQQEIADTWLNYTPTGMKYNGGSVEDYKNQIRGTDEYQSIVSQFGQETAESILSSFVEGMTSANTELAKQQSKEDSDQAFKDKFSNASFNEFSKKTFQQQFGVNEDNANWDGFFEKVFSPQAKEQIGQQLAQAVDEASNLSDDEKIQLKDLVASSDGSIEELSNIVSAGLEKGLDSAKQQAKAVSGEEVSGGRLTDYTNKLSSVDTDLKDTYEVDNADEAASVLKDQMKSADDLSESYNRLTEASKETSDETGELTDSAKDAQKRLKNLDKETDTMAKTALRSEKAMESLNENFEDWSDTLESGTTDEQVEAMSKLEDTVGDLLNIDLSGTDWGEDFVRNNLDLIEAAANGDEQALIDLQAAAAQQIAIDINDDSAVMSQENLDLLQNKALELSNLDIEVGASLDDQPLLILLTICLLQVR